MVRLIRLFIVLTGLFAGLASVALAQAPATAMFVVSGRVTSTSTSAGLSGVSVNFYSASGSVVAHPQTNATGDYSVALSSGTYYASTGNVDGFVDQVYRGIQCATRCFTLDGSPIVVSSGNVSGLDFALQPGGRIGGTVTGALGAPVADITVQVFNDTGAYVTDAYTDASGRYTSNSGLVAGTYFVKAWGDLGYIGEVYNNVSCVNCNAVLGTAVHVAAGVTTAQIDFALDRGARISGRVLDASTGLPIQGAQVSLYGADGLFSVAVGHTDAFGNYTTDAGVPTGTYFAKVYAFGAGIDELYDGIPCVDDCLANAGTPIALTAGATTSNINFTVGSGATLTGRVTSSTGTALSGVMVLIYSTTGASVAAGYTDAYGFYVTSPGVIPGTYFAETYNTQGFVDQVFDSVACAAFACSPTSGTPIPLAAGAARSLDFHLSTGGRIAGTVRDATTSAPLPGVSVLVYDSANRFVAAGTTNGSGSYTTDHGLSSGTYFAVTTNSLGLANKLFDSMACVSCTATTGTPIPVTAGATTRNVDFVLSTASGGVNVAAAVRGAVATASSTFSAAYPPSGAIDGDRLGQRWGAGGGWADATPNQFPDWLQVDFPISQAVSEVDVFLLQDNYAAPVVPTLSTTCSLYCASDFLIQTWNGAQWATVPAGVISGNTQVWRRVNFAPVLTSRIRVLVIGPRSGYSRIAEVEAYAITGTAPGAFSKSSPASAAAQANPALVQLAWQPSAGAATYEYCLDTTANDWCDSGWVSTSSLGAVVTGLTANTSYYWQVRARNPIGIENGDAGQWFQFTTGVPSIRINVAAAVNGGTATASSTFSSAFAASGAINGEHKGVGWGSGGAWADATPNDFTTEWLQVDFAGPQTIGEIDVYGLPDTLTSPAEPSLSTACTVYCLTAFQVQTWDGAQWVTAGTASGNTQVWRQFLFTPVTTSRIRVLITSALASYSRVVEVEAYASFSQAPAAFGKSTPASGATGVDTGQAALTWRPSARATRYEYCVDTTNDNTCDGTWTSLAATSATLSGLRPNTAYSWQVRAVNALGTTEADGGMSRQFTTGALSIRVNVAAAANGGTATASSTFSYAFLANGVINGEHRGLGWGTSGAWADATPNQGGDWVQVDFAGPQTIDEIDVYGLPDNFTSPSEPTLGTMCTLYCLTDFQAQVWNGTQWVTVPGGTVGSNTQVWRQILFAPVTTSRIRVLISNALASYSRVVEVEAYATVVAQPAAFAKTAPSNAATPLSGQTTFTWQAAAGATRYEYCVDTTNNSACDTAWTSVGGFTSVTATLTAGTVYYWQVRAINAVGITVADGGTWWTVTPVTRMNVAAAANGATATASSSFSGSFPASGVINGDHKGLGWGTGGAWADATPGGWDDSIEVSFASAQTINEIDVYGLPDNFTTPAEPTIGTVCTLYCLREFQVQAWDAAHAQWGTVPGGTVVGNTWVWRQFVFPAVTTTKIRVVVSNAMASYSRVVEIEAYPAPSEPAAPTGGTVFTFGGGSGNLTTSTQAGFTLTPTAANWSFFGVGAPWPSIVFWSPTGATSDGEVRVTSGGSSFQFRSVDLYSSITPIPYTITGLAGSTVVFTISGTLGNTFGALATVANGQPTASIDTLLIRLTDPAPPGGVNPMGVDNIVLAR